MCIGNANGSIQYYNYKSKEKKCFIEANIPRQDLTCIDIHPLKTYVVSGSNKGHIAIWNYEKLLVISSFTTNYQIPILTIKFLRYQHIRLIWSDIGGELSISELKMTSTGLGLVHTLLLRYFYSFDVSLSPTADIIAVIGVDSIRVFRTNSPSSNLLNYKIENTNKSILPYAGWGSGELPNDANNVYPILAIAYDNRIQLICQTPKCFIYNGYYQSDTEIISLHWVGDSVISIIDTNNSFKLLFTGKFAPGKYSDKPLKDSSELQKPFPIENKTAWQNIFLGWDQKLSRSSYHKTIRSCNHISLCLNEIGIQEVR